MEALASPPPQQGITVLELLLALAVATLLVTLGSASLQALQAELRLTATVNQFVHAIHSARLTALRTGHDVVLCPSADAGRCDSDSDWHGGWLAFVNHLTPATLQPDSGERVLQETGPYAGLTIRGNRRQYVFRPFGRRSTNGTLVFCDTSGGRPPRAVIISYTGKPRASRRSASGGSLDCGSAT